MLGMVRNTLHSTNPIIALGGFDDLIASEVFATGVLAVAGISWLRCEVAQQQAEE